MNKKLKRFVFRIITLRIVNNVVLLFSILFPLKYRAKLPVVKNLKFEIEKNKSITIDSDGGDSIINNIYWNGGLEKYEPDTMRLIKKFSFPNGNYFDIGANSGIYSILIAKLYPESTIHAFEPVPRNVEYFKKYISDNKFTNIVLNDIALSDSNGEIEFNFQDSITLPLGGSLRNDISNPDLKIKVKTITLDSYLENNKLTSLDFIKIDTEGAENEVIKGAVNSLKKFKPIVVLEVLPLLDITRLTSVMNELEYSFYKITESNEIPVSEITADESFHYKNYLFIPKSYSS